MTRGVDIAMALVLVVCGLMIITSIIVHSEGATRRGMLLDLAAAAAAFLLAAVILWW